MWMKHSKWWLPASRCLISSVQRSLQILPLTSWTFRKTWGYGSISTPTSSDVSNRRVEERATVQRLWRLSVVTQGMARRVQPRSPIENPCNHPEIPLNIFRVSHAVFEDASSALYSRNQFRLTLRRSMTLKNLRRSAEASPASDKISSRRLSALTIIAILRLIMILNLSPQSVLRRWKRFCNSVPQTIPGLRISIWSAR